jgi:hypothetical protein
MAARFRGLHGLDRGNAPLWRFPGSGQNFAGRVTIEPSVMQHSKALASVWKATYVLGDSGPSMKEQMPVLATWTVSRFHRGQSSAYACDRAFQRIVPHYQRLYDLAQKH